MKPKLGRISTSHTARGSVIQTRFAVVDASQLLPSHDPRTLEPNKRYSSKLQPRERSRLTSDQQIEGISRNLRPELLGDSLMVTDGSPITGPDLAVESGNARAIAIIRAYGRNDSSAKRYRQWLVANLKELGLSTKGLPARPVIIRVRQTRVNRYQFVAEANETAVASMSDAEQARIDANRLDRRMLAMFHPGDEGRNPAQSGDLFVDGNMDFVKAFFNSIVAPAERGRYIDSQGLVSQQGVKRIRNAILAKAFSDTPEGFWTMERMAESIESNVRVIFSALVLKAPQFVEFRQGVADGHRFPLDITGDIVKALKTLSDLKARGLPVADYLAQGNLLGAGPDQLEGLLLTALDWSKEKRQHLEDVLSNYLRLANAQGSPQQLHLTARPDPTKLELLEQAIAEFQRDAQLLSPPKRRRGRNALREAA